MQTESERRGGWKRERERVKERECVVKYSSEIFSGNMVF